MSNVKPYSWVVRFDVAPQWVADGFIMTDTTALEMLSDVINYANDHELAALVISAPDAERISEEQGYLASKEVAIKWSAAPDMTPQTVLYRRPVAQFSNFQPKIVSSWLILALFQANFLISGRSRLCPYQLVNSNQVRQGE